MASSPAASYWCYSCDRFVRAAAPEEGGAAAVECPGCGGGFLEEMGAPPPARATAAYLRRPRAHHANDLRLRLLRRPRAFQHGHRAPGRTWHRAAWEEPALWRHIDFRHRRVDDSSRWSLRLMAYAAVRRSQRRCEAFWGDGTVDERVMSLLLDSVSGSQILMNRPRARLGS